MSIKITSPIKGFNESSTFGPLTLSFKDGVAEVDELPKALRAWLERKGYKVEDAAAEPEGPFDPAKHNQDKVIEHLEADGIEAEEVERVLAAEATRENGARQKIAAWAEARAADEAAKQDAGQGGGDGQ